MSKQERPYILKRSQRRTLGLEITPELQLIVRAPSRLSVKDIDHFIAQHMDWIDKHIEIQRNRVQQRPPEPTGAEVDALIQQAREYLPGRVEHYARLMGVMPTGITITGARTRFGSCSPKNRICFSYHLMRYPQKAVDYVVVHELAHIVHKNHSRAFYDCIAQVMPDHKARRALLREGVR